MSEETPITQQHAATPVARPVFRPWQFGLKGMLLGVTALCVLFAVMGAAGVLGGVALGWFALLALAHVVGNVLGTRLRDDIRRQREQERLEQLPQPRRDAPPPPNRLPPVKLHENTRVSRLAIACAFFGVLGGAILGLSMLWGQANGIGVLIGTISFAVLAGFFCFTAGSFMQMVGRAWGEALEG